MRHLLIVLASAVSGSWSCQVARAQPAEEGPEVLTRGPVHEAFATPVVFDPSPGMIASKEPPAPIEELPPAHRPAGEQVQWVPGYWSWDDDREDFLWVSGIWRVPPSGRQWIPGYWRNTGVANRWVPGFWGRAAQAGTFYLPPPPPRLELRPAWPPPAEDRFWVPGNWLWQDGNYLWRSGYWARSQPNWIWVPSYYAWTPRGYVFVDGYWDYLIERRGLLFAPVYFGRPLYARPGYRYSPGLVIETSNLTVHLFARPSYYHYYFGDYYDDRYYRSGYYPWFSFHQSRHGYDPLFGYYRGVRQRTDPGWADGLRLAYLYLRDRRDERPPRTLAEQQLRLRRQPRNRSEVIARPLLEAVRDRRETPPLQRIGEAPRQEQQKLADAVRQLRRERRRVETPPTPNTAQPRQLAQPEVVPLPKSPIRGRPDSDRRAGQRPLPDRPKAPDVERGQRRNSKREREPRRKDKKDRK